MRIPETLASQWSHEPEWLASLSGLVSELAVRWTLELEEPFETPHALVIPAGETVLKVNAPSHFEADHEADALEAWRGEGAVRLLARDDTRRALLVERCRPGTRLWDSEAAEADEITVVAQLLRTLPREIEGHARRFRLLSEEARRWAVAVRERYRRTNPPPFERMLLEEALDVFRTVDETAHALVNQDLHGANILRAERSPWLVVDPKPLVGERELTAVGILRNAAWRRQSLARWLDALRELGLDRDRLRRWGVAHALAWGWDEHSGWSARSVDAARAIAAAR